jgi:CelD/BcsL family acetyltransferase involved in cellulose biosynthesis
MISSDEPRAAWHLSNSAATARTPTWSLHAIDGSLGEHAAAWDRLNRQLTQGLPTLDSRFIDPMLRHFGTGREVLCVLERTGEPAAMCILTRRSAAVWAAFMPSQAQIGPLLLYRIEDAGSLVRSLPWPTQRVELLGCDPALMPLGAAGIDTGESLPQALTMNIDTTGSFEAYWNGRSKNLRKNMRRYANRAEQDGLRIEHRLIRGAAEVTAAVERYATLEAAGWKAGQGTAITRDNEQGRFYRDSLGRFAADGAAEVHELWFNDRLAASRLIVVGAGSLVILKTTYDESLAAYAPGRLLLQHVLQDAFARHPGKSVEFYTDATEEQLAWATGSRRIEHRTAHRSRAAATLYRVLHIGYSVARGDGGADGDVAVDLHTDCDELPADAAALLDEAEHEDINFGLAWFRNLQQTVFAGDPGLRIAVLRRDGRATAVLPLLVRGGRFGGHAEALANYYTTLYAPALRQGLRAAELTPLLRALRRLPGGLARLTLAPMDPTSIAFKTLQAALDADGFATFRYFAFGNWYLRAHGGWPIYQANRDGKLRSTIKRMGAKLQAEGGRVEIVTSGEALPRALQAYAQVYGASWKVPEPHATFVPELARLCAERGWLRMGLVWLGEQPIAAQLWIVANGKAAIYKLAYDADFKRYSPGTVLTAALMQHVIERDGVREVDYLIGDDPYKKAWMSDRRERWGLVAYNPRTAAGLAGWLREATGRALKRLLRRWGPQRAAISFE